MICHVATRATTVAAVQRQDADWLDGRHTRIEWLWLDALDARRCSGADACHRAIAPVLCKLLIKQCIQNLKGHTCHHNGQRSHTSSGPDCQCPRPYPYDMATHAHEGMLYPQHAYICQALITPDMVDDRGDSEIMLPCCDSSRCRPACAASALLELWMGLGAEVGTTGCGCCCGCDCCMMTLLLAAASGDCTGEQQSKA